MRDEGELIRAAAAGDGRAFGELVLRKQELVIRTAFHVVGDWEDARDAAQTVFLRLWKVLRRFDPGRRFDTWLYRITVNVAIDQLRTRGPRGFLQPLPPDVGEVPAVAPTSPEEAIDLRELQRAFLRLAARLAPKQRAVFVLKEIEGLSTEDVARALGVRQSTVRNHLLQARRVLREGLVQEYPKLAVALPRDERGEEGP